jgi:hypothetical protein
MVLVVIVTVVVGMGMPMVAVVAMVVVAVVPMPLVGVVRRGAGTRVAMVRQGGITAGTVEDVVVEAMAGWCRRLGCRRMVGHPGLPE